MSGLEQRTKDRDGASVDRRGVTLRAAGVSRPATGLAEIAQIAQTPKTSMTWASARCRDVPPLIAQIAETSLRSAGQPSNMWWTNAGLLETAKTGNTEKRLECARSPKVLRVSTLPSARRVARTDINSNPWWIDLHANTNEPRNAGGNSGNTEIPAHTISCVVRVGRVWRCPGLAVSPKGAVGLDRSAETAGMAQISKTATKWASAPCRDVLRKSAEIFLKYSLAAPRRRGTLSEMCECDRASLRRDEIEGWAERAYGDLVSDSTAREITGSQFELKIVRIQRTRPNRLQRRKDRSIKSLPRLACAVSNVERNPRPVRFSAPSVLAPQDRAATGTIRNRVKRENSNPENVAIEATSKDPVDRPKDMSFRRAPPCLRLREAASASRRQVGPALDPQQAAGERLRLLPGRHKYCKMQSYLVMFLHLLRQKMGRPS